MAFALAYAATLALAGFVLWVERTRPRRGSVSDERLAAIETELLSLRDEVRAAKTAAGIRSVTGR